MKKEAFTGVSNPYAIAEIVAGRRIRWDSLDNRDKVLESILHIPEKDIFIGSVPYLVLILVVAALIWVFPSLASWLPSQI